MIPTIRLIEGYIVIQTDRSIEGFDASLVQLQGAQIVDPEHDIRVESNSVRIAVRAIHNVYTISLLRGALYVDSPSYSNYTLVREQQDVLASIVEHDVLVKYVRSDNGHLQSFVVPQSRITQPNQQIRFTIMNLENEIEYEVFARGVRNGAVGPSSAPGSRERPAQAPPKPETFILIPSITGGDQIQVQVSMPPESKFDSFEITKNGVFEQVMLQGTAVLNSIANVIIELAVRAINRGVSGQLSEPKRVWAGPRPAVSTFTYIDNIFRVTNVSGGHPDATGTQYLVTGQTDDWIESSVSLRDEDSYQIKIRQTLNDAYGPESDAFIFEANMNPKVESFQVTPLDSMLQVQFVFNHDDDTNNVFHAVEYEYDNSVAQVSLQSFLGQFDYSFVVDNLTNELSYRVSFRLVRTHGTDQSQGMRQTFTQRPAQTPPKALTELIALNVDGIRIEAVDERFVPEFQTPGGQQWEPQLSGIANEPFTFRYRWNNRGVAGEQSDDVTRWWGALPIISSLVPHDGTLTIEGQMGRTDHHLKLQHRYRRSTSSEWESDWIIGNTVSNLTNEVIYDVQIRQAESNDESNTILSFGPESVILSNSPGKQPAFSSTPIVFPDDRSLRIEFTFDKVTDDDVFDVVRYRDISDESNLYDESSVVALQIGTTHAFTFHINELQNERDYKFDIWLVNKSQDEKEVIGSKTQVAGKPAHRPVTPVVTSVQPTSIGLDVAFSFNQPQLEHTDTHVQYSVDGGQTWIESIRVNTHQSITFSSSYSNETLQLTLRGNNRGVTGGASEIVKAWWGPLPVITALIPGDQKLTISSDPGRPGDNHMIQHQTRFEHADSFGEWLNGHFVENLINEQIYDVKIRQVKFMADDSGTLSNFEFGPESAIKSNSPGKPPNFSGTPTITPMDRELMIQFTYQTVGMDDVFDEFHYEISNSGTSIVVNVVDPQLLSRLDTSNYSVAIGDKQLTNDQEYAVSMRLVNKSLVGDVKGEIVQLIGKPAETPAQPTITVEPTSSELTIAYTFNPPITLSTQYSVDAGMSWIEHHYHDQSPIRYDESSNRTLSVQVRGDNRSVIGPPSAIIKCWWGPLPSIESLSPQETSLTIDYKFGRLDIDESSFMQYRFKVASQTDWQVDWTAAPTGSGDAVVPDLVADQYYDVQIRQAVVDDTVIAFGPASTIATNAPGKTPQFESTGDISVRGLNERLQITFSTSDVFNFVHYGIIEPNKPNSTPIILALRSQLNQNLYTFEIEDLVNEQSYNVSLQLFNRADLKSDVRVISGTPTNRADAPIIDADIGDFELSFTIKTSDPDVRQLNYTFSSDVHVLVDLENVAPESLLPQPVWAGQAHSALSIARALHHTLMILNDGSMWTTGSNNFGQLGLGDTKSRETFSRTLITGWIKVVTSNNHSLALKNDGTLWSWGSNEFHQLGYSNQQLANHSQKQIDLTIDDLTFLDIACENTRSFAIDLHGRLWFWGDRFESHNGELATTPELFDSANQDLRWKAIISGAKHTLGLTLDNDLYVWGIGGDGQLGLGDDIQTVLQPTRIKQGIVTVFALINNSFAIDSDGKVWQWGEWNEASIPQELEFALENQPHSDQTMISASHIGSVFVLRGHKIWTWDGAAWSRRETAIVSNLWYGWTSEKLKQITFSNEEFDDAGVHTIKFTNLTHNNRAYTLQAACIRDDIEGAHVTTTVSPRSRPQIQVMPVASGALYVTVTFEHEYNGMQVLQYRLLPTHEWHNLDAKRVITDLINNNEYQIIVRQGPTVSQSRAGPESLGVYGAPRDLPRIEDDSTAATPLHQGLRITFTSMSTFDFVYYFITYDSTNGVVEMEASLSKNHLNDLGSEYSFTLVDLQNDVDYNVRLSLYDERFVEGTRGREVTTNGKPAQEPSKLQLINDGTVPDYEIGDKSLAFNVFVSQSMQFDQIKWQVTSGDAQYEALGALSVTHDMDDHRVIIENLVNNTSYNVKIWAVNRGVAGSSLDLQDLTPRSRPSVLVEPNGEEGQLFVSVQFEDPYTNQELLEYVWKYENDDSFADFTSVDASNLNDVLAFTIYDITDTAQSIIVKVRQREHDDSLRPGPISESSYGSIIKRPEFLLLTSQPFRISSVTQFKFIFEFDEKNPSTDKFDSLKYQLKSFNQLSGADEVIERTIQRATMEIQIDDDDDNHSPDEDARGSHLGQHRSGYSFTRRAFEMTTDLTLNLNNTTIYHFTAWLINQGFHSLVPYVMSNLQLPPSDPTIYVDIGDKALVYHIAINDPAVMLHTKLVYVQQGFTRSLDVTTPITSILIEDIANNQSHFFQTYLKHVINPDVTSESKLVTFRAIPRSQPTVELTPMFAQLKLKVIFADPYTEKKFMQYRLDESAFIDYDLPDDDTFIIGGLTNGQPYTIEVRQRATSLLKPGPLSKKQTATPNAAPTINQSSMRSSPEDGRLLISLQLDSVGSYGKADMFYRVGQSGADVLVGEFTDLATGQDYVFHVEQLLNEETYTIFVWFAATDGSGLIAKSPESVVDGTPAKSPEAPIVLLDPTVDFITVVVNFASDTNVDVIEYFLNDDLPKELTVSEVRSSFELTGEDVKKDGVENYIVLRGINRGLKGSLSSKHGAWISQVPTLDRIQPGDQALTLHVTQMKPNSEVQHAYRRSSPEALWSSWIAGKIVNGLQNDVAHEVKVREVMIEADGHAVTSVGPNSLIKTQVPMRPVVIDDLLVVSEIDALVVQFSFNPESATIHRAMLTTNSHGAGPVETQIGYNDAPSSLLEPANQNNVRLYKEFAIRNIENEVEYDAQLRLDRMASIVGQDDELLLGIPIQISGRPVRMPEKPTISHLESFETYVLVYFSFPVVEPSVAYDIQVRNGLESLVWVPTNTRSNSQSQSLSFELGPTNTNQVMFLQIRGVNRLFPGPESDIVAGWYGPPPLISNVAPSDEGLDIVIDPSSGKSATRVQHAYRPNDESQSWGAWFEGTIIRGLQNETDYQVKVRQVVTEESSLYGLAIGPESSVIIQSPGRPPQIKSDSIVVTPSSQQLLIDFEFIKTLETDVFDRIMYLITGDTGLEFYEVAMNDIIEGVSPNRYAFAISDLKDEQTYNVTFWLANFSRDQMYVQGESMFVQGRPVQTPLTPTITSMESSENDITVEYSFLGQRNAIPLVDYDVEFLHPAQRVWIKVEPMAYRGADRFSLSLGQGFINRTNAVVIRGVNRGVAGPQSQEKLAWYGPRPLIRRLRPQFARLDIATTAASGRPGVSTQHAYRPRGSVEWSSWIDGLQVTGLQVDISYDVKLRQIDVLPSGETAFGPESLIARQSTPGPRPEATNIASLALDLGIRVTFDFSTDDDINQRFDKIKFTIDNGPVYTRDVASGEGSRSYAFEIEQLQSDTQYQIEWWLINLTQSPIGDESPAKKTFVQRTLPDLIVPSVTAIILDSGLSFDVTVPDSLTRVDAVRYSLVSNELMETSLSDSSPLTTSIETDRNWLKISVGQNHALAIKNDRTLWTWTINSTTPAQVGADNDWHDVAAGFEISMAIKTSGILFSWGRATAARGLRSSDQVNTPTLTHEPTTSRWKSVTTSRQSEHAVFNHSLGVKVDGSLWAWGFNRSGALGFAPNANAWNAMRVGTQNNWTFVSCANERSFAINDRSEMYAWGRNGSGTLGINVTLNNTNSIPESGSTTLRLVTTPTRIGSSFDWRYISSHAGHSIAITTDNRLAGWGANECFQLGVQRAQSIYESIKAPTLLGSSVNGGTIRYHSVSTNGTSTVATRLDGSLWKWGQFDDGEHPLTMTLRFRQLHNNRKWFEGATWGASRKIIAFENVFSKIVIRDAVSSVVGFEESGILSNNTRYELDVRTQNDTVHSDSIRRSYRPRSMPVIVVTPGTTRTLDVNVNFKDAYDEQQFLEFSLSGGNQWHPVDVPNKTFKVSLLENEQNYTVVVRQRELAHLDLLAGPQSDPATNSPGKPPLFVDSSVHLRPQDGQITVVFEFDRHNAEDVFDRVEYRLKLGSGNYGTSQIARVSDQIVSVRPEFGRQLHTFVVQNLVNGLYDVRLRLINQSAGSTFVSASEFEATSIQLIEVIPRISSVIKDEELQFEVSVDQVVTRLNYEFYSNDTASLRVPQVQPPIESQPPIEPQPPIEDASQTQYKQISVGDTFVLAIDENDFLNGFRYNYMYADLWDHGQMGNRGNLQRMQFANSSLSSATKIRSVSAGKSHALVVTTSGELWSWGLNSDHQLGFTDLGFSERLTEPRRIGLQSNWMSIAAGAGVSAAINESGQLFEWGRPIVGDYSVDAKRLPTQIDPSVTWSSIQSGSNHLCAISSDGHLYIWGTNAQHQLGLGLPVSHKQRHPIRLGSETWKSVALGNHVTFGVRSDNTLWRWGTNSSYLLGIQDSNNKWTESYSASFPIEKKHLSYKWGSVGVGLYRVLAITTSGVMFGWGGSSPDQEVYKSPGLNARWTSATNSFDQAEYMAALSVEMSVGSVASSQNISFKSLRNNNSYTLESWAVNQQDIERTRASIRAIPRSKPSVVVKPSQNEGEIDVQVSFRDEYTEQTRLEYRYKQQIQSVLYFSSWIPVDALHFSIDSLTVNVVYDIVVRQRLTTTLLAGPESDVVSTSSLLAPQFKLSSLRFDVMDGGVRFRFETLLQSGEFTKVRYQIAPAFEDVDVDVDVDDAVDTSTGAVTYAFDILNLTNEQDHVVRLRLVNVVGGQHETSAFLSSIMQEFVVRPASTPSQPHISVVVSDSALTFAIATDGIATTGIEYSFDGSDFAKLYQTTASLTFDGLLNDRLYALVARGLNRGVTSESITISSMPRSRPVIEHLIPAAIGNALEVVVSQNAGILEYKYWISASIEGDVPYTSLASDVSTFTIYNLQNEVSYDVKVRQAATVVNEHHIGAGPDSTVVSNSPGGTPVIVVDSLSVLALSKRLKVEFKVTSDSVFDAVVVQVGASERREVSFLLDDETSQSYSFEIDNLQDGIQYTADFKLLNYSRVMNGVQTGVESASIQIVGTPQLPSMHAYVHALEDRAIVGYVIAHAMDDDVQIQYRLAWMAGSGRILTEWVDSGSTVSHSSFTLHLTNENVEYEVAVRAWSIYDAEPRSLEDRQVFSIGRAPDIKSIRVESESVVLLP